MEMHDWTRTGHALDAPFVIVLCDHSGSALTVETAFHYRALDTGHAVRGHQRGDVAQRSCGQPSYRVAASSADSSRCREFESRATNGAILIFSVETPVNWGSRDGRTQKD
eukprot:jgi/Chrzof1/15259/UNPLg00653.t1